MPYRPRCDVVLVGQARAPLGAKVARLGLRLMVARGSELLLDKRLAAQGATTTIGFAPPMISRLRGDDGAPASPGAGGDDDDRLCAAYDPAQGATTTIDFAPPIISLVLTGQRERCLLQVRPRRAREGRTMRRYYQELVEERLKDLFDEQDKQTVLTWLISNDGRLPVVVVGAGFSLNAIDKRTGVNATTSEVPLWSHVLGRFEQDLRFAQGGYDALTYAELYLEEMGTAKFNCTLLEMLKDGQIAPGRAHEALSAYPKEAIVTTNNLDTLLDRNDLGWRRVVYDPDLALRGAGPGAIDLIYFHGHRGDPESWVFTRSHYEDIHKTRPLIVTKVRQLLSQHPVLIVGYSLSDPDFHHIYRQLSLDMSYHHPLGLALFPHGRGPRTAERQHWEKLGIRIATFRRDDKKSITDQFARFFEINPTPRAPLANADDIKGWIAKGRDFAARCDRARDFLSEPAQSRTVDVDRNGEYTIWLEPIRRQFTDQEWKEANFIHRDDIEYDETMSVDARKRSRSGQSDPSAVFRGFKVIDRQRFSSQGGLSRQVDAFLLGKSDMLLALGQWMAFAIEAGILGYEKPLFADMVSWIWRTVAEQKKDNRGEAPDVLRRCCALALKNGYEHVQKHIEEDAKAIGLDLSEVTAAGDRPKEFLDKMKEGFDSMLDGAFPVARRAYAQAVAIAKQHGDSFGEWAAFHGEEDAAFAGIGWEGRSDPKVQAEADD